ncbi:MAG: class I SAM-dependent methyltransferase [Phycisphaerae bacterium]
MRRISLLLMAILLLIVAAGGSPVATSTDSWQGTRVTDSDQHQPAGTNRYPYRAKSDYVLRELDLRPGDVVVDIGAGDGFWAERMAAVVGKEGTIHASEVEQNKVDRMKERFTDLTQVRPYLCPTDGTGLQENSCELAFLSKTYHHLDEDGRVDYLRHLREVVRPTGRLCVIERYANIAGQRGSHDMLLSQLVKQAEEAGWIAVRYELMTGTYHYIAIFVQKDLFPPERSSRRREDR